MEQKIKLESSLIKIVGIFSYTKHDIKRFIDSGYKTIPIVESESDPSKMDAAKKATLDFYKDTYYKEFAEIMLIGQGKNIKHTVKPFNNSKKLSSLAIKIGRNQNSRWINVNIENRELFLFDNSIGIFAVTILSDEQNLNDISDITAFARNFSCEVMYESIVTNFEKWISEFVLCGIPLKGSIADDFSGSKFKIYSILNIDEKNAQPDYDRSHLLYEIGTGSKLGTIKDGGYYAPSSIYTDQLLENRISIFNNWDALCLLDSFTVIGGDVYSKSTTEYHKHHSWNRVYFSIYIYNLFMRYSLFMFNHKFLDDEIEARDQYQEFLNRYNFKYISFNFLPNILFEGIRKGLNLENEIDFFENRIGNLANSIQDKQEKRQALLLGIISILSSISAIEPIIELLNNTRDWLGWSNFLFYTLLLLFVILIGMPIMIYLFPGFYKKIKNKWL
jgi:hypothetical protein